MSERNARAADHFKRHNMGKRSFGTTEGIAFFKSLTDASLKMSVADISDAK